MKVDKFGQIILDEQDLFNLYMKNGFQSAIETLTDEPIHFNSELELDYLPKLINYRDQDISVEKFDLALQDKWKMPPEYENMDIAVWLLDRCETDEQRQRVGKELLMYLDRNLFKLLQYLKYLVDTMRKHNIIWGVGRGSSVSSYVLFLLGVHRIDSIYYDLPIEEFLR